MEYITDINDLDLDKKIKNHLEIEGKWEEGNPNYFNRVSAIDEDAFVRFIVTSQKVQWDKHCQNHPKNPQAALIKSFQDEVEEKNLLYVLRHGFKDNGIKFLPCIFKPESTMNEIECERYKMNIFHFITNLKYSMKNDKSIDIVLLLNGIPVVSIETKSYFEKQENLGIVEQYKFDRLPKDKIFEFKKRILVHFAIDLYEVYMTTKLEGENTRFLPFNQGSNGAGNVGGKGNPKNEDGFDTDYLFKEILTTDSIMEILHKYIHLQSIDIKDREGNIVEHKETIIFPRFHQLDVVRKLLSDVKKVGSGKNYLIQHSAGSGKSNSIAWLAHRLQSLHNKNNEIIFNSVIVVTDRKILDSQLQDTIYQFDHVKGVVKPIKQGSLSLKQALNDGIKIIITTLQKFPYIYKDVEATGKKYAVIIDEAHSSQSGIAAKKLKTALADINNSDDILEHFAKEEETEELNTKDYEDNLIKELLTHGNHKNISFFAFTATPKNKTLQMFGEKQQNGNYIAFHTYSMRQAIEEGFILDVLQNYTTYQQYYKIKNKVNEKFEYNKYKNAILKFESLHPHNIYQKTAIMIEHFREITKKKINGRAKAMVVTASRLHAIRYFFEFQRYIKAHNYNDINILVAFSGSLSDKGKEWSEEKININKKGEHIKENQLKDYFKNEFDILIVAEKYQTGFDEPLLHTMFVDKKLSGTKAVQTLSRLNRTMKGKEDTFVLDFANKKEEIKRAFQPFYEASVLEKEINQDLIYDLKNQLEKFGIFKNQEIQKFAKYFYINKEKTTDVLKQIIDKSKKRYEIFDEKQKKEFKQLLSYFNNTYTFLIQITGIFDKEIQKYYVFAKFLEKNLPKNNVIDIDLDDTLLLQYYKLQKTSEGAIKLESNGKNYKKQESKTRQNIIDKFNKKFVAEYTKIDVVIQSFKELILKDEQIINAGKNRDKTAFNTLYEKKFTDIAMTKYEETLRYMTETNSFFKKIFENAEQLKLIKKLLLDDIYKELKND